MKFQQAISLFSFNLPEFLATPANGSSSHSTDPAFVYLFECGDFIKVGVTRNISQRLRDMTPHSPHSIELAGYRTLPTFRYAMICEKAAHVMLTPYAHRNEWFLVSAATARLALDTSYRSTLRLIRRHQTVRRQAANDNAPHCIAAA